MVKNAYSRPLRLAFLMLFVLGCLVPAPTATSAPRDIPITGAEVTPSPEEVTPADTVEPQFSVDTQQITTDSLTHYLPLISNSVPPLGGWPMVGANPQRTHWTPDEVTGQLNVAWYRPIEAYIDQKVQIIGAYGRLYLSTARGLVVLNAANGALVWRYNTELPLGHSPTVNNNVVYVAGYDRKLHALDAHTGAHLWEFTGAGAGYDTNPLVVEGKVILGNRDGAVYAIGAHGAAQQGQQVWRFQTGGPVHQSAAYTNGTIYFASDDHFAYAVRVSDGAQVWKSAELPGDGFQSYSPVIFRDKLILATANRYSMGTPSDPTTFRDITALWPAQVEGSLAGPAAASVPWANGYPVMNAHNLLEMFEAGPADPGNLQAHMPSRRTILMLNQSNGQEFTFDSDGDGHQEYFAAMYWHTGNGTLYPGLVGPDSIFYHNNAFRCCSDAKGKVYGWNPDQPDLLSMVGSRNYGDPTGGFAAMAEPQALSGGGRVIYRSLCCDRVGDWFSIDANPRRIGQLYSYNLATLAPGYNEMWLTANGAIANHIGWYKGTIEEGVLYDTTVGMYHSHGVQNPLIPYDGHLFIHRGNAIIAFGPGASAGKLPTIPIVPVQDNVATPSTNALTARLEAEIVKMLDAGHLRPGYAVTFVGNYGEFSEYFGNPGDTLYTLSLAYPYLTPATKQRVADYLNQSFVPTYLGTTLYRRMGWDVGAAREWMPLPPDVTENLTAIQKSVNAPARLSMTHPWVSIYALYKYAQNVPGANIAQAYTLAKTQMQNQAGIRPPLASEATTFADDPFIHNAIITGHHGFLKLQELAGMTVTDATLRVTTQTELTRLLALRSLNFTKDSPWAARGNHYRRALDLARNFMYLSPELAEYMQANLLAQVADALAEYDYVAPYWFVGKYDAIFAEYSTQNLYTLPALFQAKAMILDQPRSQLYKYLDVPAFERGDLFYIQNLIATIQAP